MEHQPPVILITSSEDEGVTDRKREREAGCWRSVEEEYMILADLTRFDNLRALLETERAHMRIKKRKRKKKKKKSAGYGGQEEVTVFGVREGELADEGFAPESNVVSGNINASPNIAVDAEREKEQVDGVKAVETTEAFKGNGVVMSSTVIDLCSSSTEEDQVEVNIRCCRAAKELVPAETVVLKRRRIRRRGKKGKMNEVQHAISSVSRKRENRSGGTVISFRTDPVDNVSQEKKDKSEGTVTPFRTDPVGSVFRKLLRGPRYFDPPSSSPDECLRCGEVHVTKKCTAVNRKKPCRLCAGYGHSWKRCTQGLDCFTCKGRGHRANRCPEKNQGGQPLSEICLRCGESGHDMLSCRTNYSLDDLKEIQCYVCKNFGHLCCVDFKDLGPPGCVSCYNCGQSGHLGSDCEELRGNARVATCSKGKEEKGHFSSIVATCSKVKEEESHSASMVATCSKLKEKEGHFASGVSTCSKHRAESRSAARWADSLLNKNAFTVAHIASICSKAAIIPADTLQPEQRLGDTSNLAPETEICKTSTCSTAITPTNTLPPEQRLGSLSTLARKTEICKANICSTTITSGDALQPKQRLGDSLTLARETEICKGSMSMPENLDIAQIKNRCGEGNFASRIATCSKGKEGHFYPRVATCLKRKAESHSAGRWVGSLLNTNALGLTQIASVSSTAITLAAASQPEERLGDSSTLAQETEVCKASICSTVITHVDTLPPKKRLGDSLTLAWGTESCEGSNSMPGNLEGAQRKNPCEEEDHFASGVATCTKHKAEGHFSGTRVDYLLNKNAFTLAASDSPAFTTANTLQPEQRFGDSLTVVRGNEIRKGSNSLPENLDEAQRKKQCEEGTIIITID